MVKIIPRVVNPGVNKKVRIVSRTKKGVVIPVKRDVGIIGIEPPTPPPVTRRRTKPSVRSSLTLPTIDVSKLRTSAQETGIVLPPTRRIGIERKGAIQPFRTKAAQEERARLERALTPPPVPKELLFGERFTPTFLREKFGEVGGPIVGATAGMSRQVLSQLDIGGMLTEPNIPIESVPEILRTGGAGALRDPASFLGEAGVLFGGLLATERLGRVVGRRIPKTKQATVTKFGERIDDIIGFERDVKSGVTTFVEDRRLQLGETVLPRKEFIKKVKAGEIGVTEELVSGRGIIDDFVSIPTAKATIKQKFRGDITGTRITSAEALFKGGLFTEKELSAFTQIKGKPSGRFRPFLEAVPEKPVSPGAGARARLFSQEPFAPVTPKLKPTKSPRIQSGLVSRLGQPIVLDVLETPLFVPLFPGRPGLKGPDLGAQLQNDLTLSINDMSRSLSLDRDNLLKQFKSTEKTQAQLNRDLVTGLASDLKFVSGSMEKQSQKLTQELKQQQKQIIGQAEAQRTRTSGRTGPRRGLPLPILLPFTDTGKKKLTGILPGVPGYNAFVKRRGVVKKATSRPRSRQTALSIGGSIVDQTPSGSFTIRKSNSAAFGPEIDTFGAISGKFRKRKTKNALELVEKDAFRIDSFGELLGIPGEAIRKRKSVTTGSLEKSLLKRGKLDTLGL